MLIYNHQKEFLGIGEEDLSILGFSNLSELRIEASDFADLFVKTPGFVHNFKHVHWIDFVTCAESSDDSKVIIRANDKNYKCILDIQVSYLIDEPTKKAYFINLVNLRELSTNENSKVSVAAVQRSVPKTPDATQDEFDTPSFNKEKQVQKQPPKEEPKVEEQPIQIEEQVQYEPTPTPHVEVAEIIDDAPLDLVGFDDFDTDFSELNEIDIDEIDDVEEVVPAQQATPTPVATPTPKPKPVATPVPAAKMYVESLNAGNNYVYDPQVASDELGLPVDLIEEFIEDFIAQAYEFKDELYKSLDDNDLDHVKVLSHKLKGVAANLRIEDAFEVLATVNTSDDTDEIMRNMNTLYLIIDKLAGKEVPMEVAEELSIAEDVAENLDDDFTIDFKSDDDPIEIDEPFTVADDLTSEIELADLDEDIAIEISDTDDLITEIALTDLDEEIGIEISDLDDISTVTYNKNLAAKDIGIDKESLDELFYDYLREGQNSCTSIKNAINQADTKLWRHDAIIFKGMSDNMRIDDFQTELESIIGTTDANIAQNAIDIIDARLKQLSQMEG